MQNIFFTSDNHFHHSNIIRLCSRPYPGVEEMSESLIQNHNAIVGAKDVVYFLGDFSFGNEKQIKDVLRRLNGAKYLILGNHDKIIAKNHSDFIHYDLFREIHNYKEIKIFNQKICMFHYSCRVWNGSHNNSWMLYGHSHGSLEPYGKSVDVGIDAQFITNEYRPVSFEEVKNFMNSRVREVSDHHV